MHGKLKGTICGIVAAISYGTNPLGALSLYADGLNAVSVLFYRYGLATVLLGLIMLAERKSFSLTRHETGIIAVLGVLFASSSLCLYMSFNFMDAGIASTILFVYPVMVAVIMAVMFKERVTVATCLSIVLALVGIALLYKGGDGVTLSTVGVLLVLGSSLTYAVYIVVVNKSSLRMSSVKLTFYVLLVGTLCIVLQSLAGEAYRLQLLTTPRQSLVLMVIAVHHVGSTPTAIMGALEPVTAVIIGVTVFGEMFTPRLAVGITLILCAVLLIIAGKSVSVNRITRVVGLLGHVLQKTWRWKS